MIDEKRHLVSVVMRELPFPMTAISRRDSAGQNTVGTISIEARVMREFEARWIDDFIRIVHRHRDRISTQHLKNNIGDYLKEMNATVAKIKYQYPFFVEKTAPVSKEKCLVRYLCAYSVKASLTSDKPTVRFSIDVPCITTYPQSDLGAGGDLFGQLSVVTIDMETQDDVFPEDMVEIVDKHAIAPVYSFLSPKDQAHIIKAAHTQAKTSVMMTDEIKEELAKNDTIDWFSINCSNFGMLHSYHTVVGTEKSMWVPMSGYTDDF